MARANPYNAPKKSHPPMIALLMSIPQPATDIMIKAVEKSTIPIIAIAFMAQTYKKAYLPVCSAVPPQVHISMRYIVPKPAKNHGLAYKLILHLK